MAPAPLKSAATQVMGLMGRTSEARVGRRGQRGTQGRQTPPAPANVGTAACAPHPGLR